MIEIALIDADIVAYRCSAVAEHDDVNIALYQTNEMMSRILHETNAMGYKAFLSGQNNFRYEIYPEYKANRVDKPRPKHLEDVKAHLIEHWNTKIVNDIEADDALGIEQCNSDSTCICSIDKDLLMIPGSHYNFVKQKFVTVSPIEGLRNFYFQLVMGDRSDNVPGFDGKMRATVPKFLQHHIDYILGCEYEVDMYYHAYEMYKDAMNGEDPLPTMLRNGQCLWIQRKENDLWKLPLET